MKAVGIITHLQGHFAGEPLAVAARKLIEADEWERAPGSLLFLRLICKQVAEAWDGNGVPAADADRMQRVLLPPMLELATAVSDFNELAILHSMNTLARVYIETSNLT